MNLARLLFVLACALYGSTGLAQSAEQLAAALEKHTVVLRNYYTNDSLTFDSDGKLISGGSVGFGPTDGRVYVEKADITPAAITLTGQRPTPFWDNSSSQFKLIDIGRKVEIEIKLPPGQQVDQVPRPVLDQVF